MTFVVKRKGKKEVFDEKKLYASIFAACQECGMENEKAEHVADRIVHELESHLKDRQEVNSTEIFGFVIEKLARINEAVAFMYQTHRELIKA
ncbi:MAG: ATP cone domain-containing protein [Candidatus ainarchaeum sp.]|nr:ATP cone domain-containing protein [Candidatus ainarchaeum sp.]